MYRRVKRINGIEIRNGNQIARMPFVNSDIGAVGTRIEVAVRAGSKSHEAVVDVDVRLREGIELPVPARQCRAIVRNFGDHAVAVQIDASDGDGVAIVQHQSTSLKGDRSIGVDRGTGVEERKISASN